MSYPVLDYLPFDYVGYTHELLPLWEQALDGKVDPLKRRIFSAHHFSLWPRINFPVVIDQDEMKHFFTRNLDTFENYYQRSSSPTTQVNLWAIFWPLLEALEAGSPPNQLPELRFLHSCLLYTLCSDLPAKQAQMGRQQYSGRMDIPWPGTIIIGHEDVPLWMEYTQRDEQTRGLWSPFLQPAPAELIGSLLFPDRYGADWVAHEPRSVFKYRLEEGPAGFLTQEETERLLRHYQRHQAPLLPEMVSSCLRDAATEELPVDLQRVKTEIDTSAGIWTYLFYCELAFENGGTNAQENEQIVYEELWKAYPEKMRSYLQRYYQRIWQIEEVIMQRVELAVSRGWGMMMMHR